MDIVTHLTTIFMLLKRLFCFHRYFWEVKYTGNYRYLSWTCNKCHKIKYSNFIYED